MRRVSARELGGSLLSLSTKFLMLPRDVGCALVSSGYSSAGPNLFDFSRKRDTLGIDIFYDDIWSWRPGPLDD